MRNFILIPIILISSIIKNYGQGGGSTTPCHKCTMNCLCSLFVQPLLTQGKASIIQQNWNDFFGANLKTDLPLDTTIKNVIDIKFDGMGCIYPKYIGGHADGLRGPFLDGHVKSKKFYKSTFYHLYEKYFRTTWLKRSFRDDTAVADFINHVITDIPGLDTTKAIDYFEFIRLWNDRYLRDKIAEINAICDDPRIKKIIFYIHGYNVPYSLAQIQGNELFSRVLADTHLNPDEVLFVRVFWPSGYFKRDKFEHNQCDFSNIEKCPAALLFTYVSNRGYLAGVALREILDNIHMQQRPIQIITHSFGATVATAALMNPYEKMQGRSVRSKITFDRSLTISDQIMNLMESKDFPFKNISVFLNAAAIPGVSTFRSWEKARFHTMYSFFIGYNNSDATLLKKKFKIRKVLIKFVHPSAHLSATTLGCNWHGSEVNQTEYLFRMYPSHFKACPTSTQTEHDFFCYFLQPEFRQKINEFLTGCWQDCNNYNLPLTVCDYPIPSQSEGSSTCKKVYVAGLTEENTDHSVYTAIQNVWYANEKISYICPMPIFCYNEQPKIPFKDGEGGDRKFLMDANIVQQLPVWMGRNQGTHKYQTSRVTFDYGIGYRMAIGNSSPLLPYDDIIGFSANKVLYTSYTGKISPKRKTLEYSFRNWYNLEQPLHILSLDASARHYSNGQSTGTFYYRIVGTDTLTRNNYKKGDFSTNYLRIGLTYSYLSKKRNLFSCNVSLQSDGNVWGPLSYMEAQEQRYGHRRVMGFVQYRLNRQHKLHGDPNVYMLSVCDSCIKRYARIRKCEEFVFRIEYEYIFDDVSKYPLDKDYRFNPHFFFEWTRQDWRSGGFVIHAYYGRDYLNIRYDLSVFTIMAGVCFNFNKFHIPFSDHQKFTLL